MTERRKALAISTIVIFAVISLRSLAQQPQQGTERLHEPHHQAGFPTLVSQGGFKYWDKGHLITWAFDSTLNVAPEKPGVILYDSAGHSREAIVWLDGAKTVGIRDVAIAKSGKLIVSGGAASPANAIASYLAEVGGNGRVKRVIRTSPFMPVHICAAEDGTVWSYGIDRDENGNGVETSPMLRQFSFEKGQMKALLFRSSLNPGWELMDGSYPGEVSLRCNTNTVAIYNARSSELVQVDILTGSLTITNVSPLPLLTQFRITGFALTESGDIFASLHDGSKSPPMSGLFKLNFDSAGGATWMPVVGTLGPYLRGSPIERLMGSDGDDLVHTRQVDGKMYWSKHGK